MSQRVARKWRPALWFVLAGPLAAVFALPLLGIGYFRLAGGVLGWYETTQIIGATALLATLILGFLLWRLVLRPLRRMTGHAMAVARGKDTTQQVHFGTSELSRLGQAVLDMERVLRGREAVLRSYADHVTHELKSPLTVVRGAAELLEGDLPEPDRAKMVAQIIAATARMTELLEAQRRLAKAQEPLPAGRCQLGQVLPETPLDVRVVNDGPVPLSADVMGLVLQHLIGNAAAHGAKTVTLYRDGACVVIADDGPGVSGGNRDRIFDPYFTTRRDSGGTGMGLSIVRQILGAQGAQITLLDGPGARFEVRF